MGAEPPVIPPPIIYRLVLGQLRIRYRRAEEKAPHLMKIAKRIPEVLTAPSEVNFVFHFLMDMGIARIKRR